MPKCYVYSHKEFDALCNSRGWSDDNVPSDIAFISICCSPSCRENYISYAKGETDEHWFKHDHSNVCNLNFDDITSDRLECERDDETKYIVYGMDDSQANKLYTFIMNNLGKNFMIHCRAGKSRSQAVCKFITTIGDNYETRPENPCIYPNIYVYNKLNRLYNGIPLEA